MKFRLRTVTRSHRPRRYVGGVVNSKKKKKNQRTWKNFLRVRAKRSVTIRHPRGTLTTLAKNGTRTSTGRGELKRAAEKRSLLAPRARCPVRRPRRRRRRRRQRANNRGDLPLHDNHRGASWPRTTARRAPTAGVVRVRLSVIIVAFVVLGRAAASYVPSAIRATAVHIGRTCHMSCVTCVTLRRPGAKRWRPFQGKGRA